MRYLLIITLAFSVVASPALAQKAVEKPAIFIGEVIVIGNTATRDWVIRRELKGILPGRILVPSELQDAERNLRRLGIFKFDPAKKIGPTVRVLDSKGPFKDILVTVEEKPTRRILVDGGVNFAAQPVVRFVMEDRNFDPFGLPTCLADIHGDRAFRGAGQKVRLELVRINILQGRIEFFQDGLLTPTIIRRLLDDAK